MKANLFYFCDDIGSVFDSQVLALLTAISEKKYFSKIYLFLGIRNNNQKNDLQTRKTPDIELVFFKSFPNYPFFNYMSRRSIRKTIQDKIINLNEVIFHTRGEMIAWHLSRSIGRECIKNIIPDVRGTSVEEIKEYSDSNRIIKSMKIDNSKKALNNIKKFNKISAVSRSLKDYLVTDYNINQRNIEVTPCLAGSAFRYDSSLRELTRKELNLKSDDTLIIFSSGGTANWQNNDVLYELAEKGVKILNLSKKEIKHQNIINKFVSYSGMPAYLNAADAAIIWRDKSIVNKAASPVKFSEYVCCGLPVIANKSVDMVWDFIKAHNCGTLIESFDDLKENDLKTLKQMDRKKISEKGITNFGVETIAEKYLQIYSTVNNL